MKGRCLCDFLSSERRENEWTIKSTERETVCVRKEEEEKKYYTRISETKRKRDALKRQEEKRKVKRADLLVSKRIEEIT